MSINGIHVVYSEGINYNKNLFVSDLFNQPFNLEKIETHMVNGAKSFPFLSYLPQALGIIVGNMLGGNAGIVFLLGRMVNLFCYACLVRSAIKTAPAYKVFIGIAGIFPISVYLAASYNPEAVVTGVGLLTISYFIYLCYMEDKRIGYKELAIYTVLCMIMAVVKLPYALLIGCALFIPKKKFKIERTILSKIIMVLICGVTALLWLIYSASIPDYAHAEYLIPAGVDAVGQVEFIIHNLWISMRIILNSAITFFDQLMKDCFTLGWLSFHIPLLAVLYLVFMGGMLFYYPKEKGIAFITRIGLALVVISIYMTIFTIQYLNWTPIGGSVVLGVQGRYFVLLFPILQLIFGSSKERNIDRIKVNNNILFYALLLLSMTMIGFFSYYY